MASDVEPSDVSTTSEPIPMMFNVAEVAKRDVRMEFDPNLANQMDPYMVTDAPKATMKARRHIRV